MLKTTYRKGLFRITHLWFCGNKQGCRGGDILYFHGLKEAPPWLSSKYTNISIQHSLIKSLDIDEETLWETLGKTLRKHIRRSQSDAIRIAFYSPQEVLEQPKLLEISSKLYEQMFSDKQMNIRFNRRLAREYAKNNALILAVAYNEADSPVGFKAVVHDEKNARAWVTAFDFRNPDYNKQIIGRAHQRMYYEILLHCKRIGIYQFDFGGINSIDNPNGIAQFKMAFGGKPVTYTNVVTANTLIGHLAIIAMRLKKKLKSLKLCI